MLPAIKLSTRPNSELERADRHQRNHRGGNQQNACHGSRLASRQQQEGKKDQKRDNEEKNERRLYEDLSNEDTDNAAGRHQDGKAGGLPKDSTNLLPVRI